ncbi:MAG: aconitate hydratase, partial [Anaerovoracaceae bacterium]
MGRSLTEKILRKHLIEGVYKVGEEVTLKIDQTLTQDSTGTMVYLQLEALEVDKIQTETSVAYIDHNTLQTGFENADDHAFIESIAKRHGVIFSKPGNGICHQLHMENYGIPGKTLLGSDSHTPTGGGIGMIAIGAGGLDVAVAMANGTYTLKIPKVIGVELTGKLRAWCSAKDVILKVLKELTVKGGVGNVIEYFGEGVSTLTASDRATITNMGAELGATTSIFPSDEMTRKYLKSQGRENDYVELSADEDAYYDKVLKINLSEIVPLAAMPHSPDNVAAIKDISGIKVDQVAIGSCTNSSYADLMKVAAILKGNKIHPEVSLVISPGSSKILRKLAENGALANIIASGGRIIENACGPCIGMGQSPKSGAVSLRTFNRNFKGRSGTLDADIYLVSPETAAISAILGILVDGQTICKNSKKSRSMLTNSSIDNSKLSALANEFELINNNNEDFDYLDSFIINPLRDGRKESTPIVMGPNIKPFPRNFALASSLAGKVALITGDNITTDDIMPSDSRLLPYRSNVPHLASYCFEKIDPNFPCRCRELEQSETYGSIIIGGENYGQGSSREHAALAPLSLGVRMVIAKSFARIHRSNLINSGIIPFTFDDEKDYNKISLGDELLLENAQL